MAAATIRHGDVDAVQRLSRILAVLTGAPNIGQAACRTWAGIIARELGLRPDQVDVISGDTAAISYGIGTFGSRTAVAVGNATALAAAALATKVKQATSRALECDPQEVDLAEGMARIRGAPERQIRLGDLALRVARGALPLPAPGLEATESFAPKGQTWASGVHAVALEVDPETSQVRLRRFVVAHDCGQMLEPELVDGQTIGGVAQAIGGALFEHLVYDEQGQPLATTFLDYALPVADYAPNVEIVHAPVPSPLNPLGVKEAGEGGCMGSYAAIAAALEDALHPLGVRVTELPVTQGQLIHILASMN